jgi:hypothetical protein
MHELSRCRDHGQDGFEKWVAWGVLAANLRTIGRKIAAETRSIGKVRYANCGRMHFLPPFAPQTKALSYSGLCSFQVE